jgi:hypothetical protein
MNAKEELLGHVALDGSDVICASIYYGSGWGEDKQTRIILPVAFTTEQWAAFLSSLDFTYDSGYGGQHLYGRVWLTDSRWMERGEYDGSEWWEVRSMPDVPNECLNT